ncbi:MAG: hypothetical protein V1929_06445 [bacterium]
MGWVYFILFCLVLGIIIQVIQAAIQYWQVSIPLIGIAIFLIVQHRSAKKKATQEAEDNRRKAEQEAEAARRKAEYDRNQELIRGRLTTLSTSATSALDCIPDSITSANRALDKAEEEYAEGVFAPFWDAVEKALRYLTQYDVSVRVITESTTHFAETSKTLDSRPPTFIPERATIPDATATVERLRVIVRRAQKIPDFAKIYEMRRTNSLLVAGFANLGSAIDNMGFRIHDSINGLAQTLDSAMSSMSQQNADYYRESLSAIETMREQLATADEVATTDSKAEREHEGKVEEMLDNIQRRKRPYIEKYRDGQY